MKSKKISDLQIKDVGIIICVCLLVIYIKTNSLVFLILSLCLLLINILYFKIYSLFALLWFKLAEYLSKISSVLILSLVYFLIVTPTALLFKLIGKDILKLKQFKSGKSTAFQSMHEAEINFKTPY